MAKPASSPPSKPSSRKSSFASPIPAELASMVAQRTPASLGFKDAFAKNRVDYGGIDHTLLFDPDFFGSHLLFDSDLWKPLTAAYGKCDGMVSGKYHPARLFSFDSGNHYVFCCSETGDRGTSWLVSSKSSPIPSPDTHDFYSYVRMNPGSNFSVEMRKFFDSLLLGMALAHPPTMAVLKTCMPSALALSEAADLRAQVPIGQTKPKASKLRV